MAWRSLAEENLGFLNSLSDVFVAAEKHQPGLIPDFTEATKLFIGSDYGGEHKSSNYHTFSFLIADIRDCSRWVRLSQWFRANHRLDKRRFAYKNISDSIRARVIREFLCTANFLPGITVVIAIHKSVGSLFGNGEKVRPTSLDFEPFHGLSAPVAEKTLRVIHLLGFLIAGVSVAGQDILWVTDEDPIAANSDRIHHLVNALARVSSAILVHNLGHLRVATSRQDPGDLSLEDLLSIPDIAAGAVGDVLTSMFPQGCPPKNFAFPTSSNVAKKSLQIMNWFSDDTRQLRRFSVIIDQKLGQPRASHMLFHGSRNRHCQ